MEGTLVKNFFNNTWGWFNLVIGSGSNVHHLPYFRIHTQKKCIFPHQYPYPYKYNIREKTAPLCSATNPKEEKQNSNFYIYSFFWRRCLADTRLTRMVKQKKIKAAFTYSEHPYSAYFILIHIIHPYLHVLVHKHILV